VRRIKLTMMVASYSSPERIDLDSNDCDHRRVLCLNDGAPIEPARPISIKSMESPPSCTRKQAKIALTEFRIHRLWGPVERRRLRNDGIESLCVTDARQAAAKKNFSETMVGLLPLSDHRG
jgi:hypothetical protein